MPVPHNNHDFEQCKFAVQACSAAMAACPKAMAAEPGGLTPTMSQIKKRTDRQLFYDAMGAQWRDLQNPRRPCFTPMDRSEVPPGKKIIPVGWTSKVKLDCDGNFDKVKMRGYMLGFHQVPGEDYDPWSCSSVPARLPVVRLVIGIAAECGLVISQGDFVCAYIESEIKEEVYVEILEGIPGMQYIGADGKRRVCKVHRSFFGAHQSSTNWEHCLRDYIMSCDESGSSSDDAPTVDGKSIERARAAATKHKGKLCISACKSDPNLYIASKHYENKAHADICIFVTYSDDVLMAASCTELRGEIFDKLNAKFPFDDKGSVHDGPLSFCGCKIEYAKGANGECNYRISQGGYVRKLLRDCKMDEANAVRRPTLPGQKYSKEDEEASIDAATYRKWAGGILWAAITCHPQIAASATVACRFMAKPTANGHALMKRILRYMAGNPDRGIVYSCKNPSLDNFEKIRIQGFCDSDWAANEDDARSTSGYVLMIANAAFDWMSKLQHCVAMSTAEAECYALCSVTVETEFYRDMLEEIGINAKSEPTEIGVDNKAAVLSAHNSSGKRTRHVNIRFHRVRSAIKGKRIAVRHVRGGTSADSEQLADVMTKSCNGMLFDKFDGAIRGIRDG